MNDISLGPLVRVEKAARDYAQWKSLSPTTQHALGCGAYDAELQLKFTRFSKALEAICPLGDLPRWGAS